jgi:plasmid stabilization system protein ParE
MEKVIKKVIYSFTFYEDLKSIYSYGLETFGFDLAEIFQEKILHASNGLSYMFLIYPECRHLETKTQIYRNIILGKYLIIYRVKSNKIEVLRALHGSQNPKIIKAIKKIKIK